MYKVISFFTDRLDNHYPYNEGDTFPRDGMEVSEERIAELSGSNNRKGKPLIAENKADKPKVAKLYKRNDINRMNKTDLLKIAESEGLEVSDETSSADLKKLLLEHLGL